MEQRRCLGCMNLITEAVCPHCGYPTGQDHEPHQLPAGTMLRGQYLVGKVLGQGGFGITYIGWDSYLDIVVAIKEFYPAAAVNRDVTLSHSVHVNTRNAEHLYINSRERFLREAKILAKLRNIPEIVGIHNFFPENNTAYIVMEYVQGIELRQFVQQNGGNLPAHVLLPILEPVAQALEAVHREGLVHRDVSPDNIMLQSDGRIKLLDFGAARDTGDADADVDLARSTEAILKHGFAPIEQYRSRGNLGPWTDEYGFCASVYYCLTGNVPPDAPSRAMDDDQPDWGSITGLTENQRSALEKGMSMRAKDRFGSMKALCDALYGIEPAAQPIPVTAPAAPDPVRAETVPDKKQKKSNIPLLAGMAAAGAIVVGLVLMLGGKNTAPEMHLETQPTTAETISAETELVEVTEEFVARAEPWECNVLKHDPLDSLSVMTPHIQTVTFLDSLADAPSDAVDVSADGTRSVLAWGAWENGQYHAFIAAEGGINGRESCEGLFESCTSLTSICFGNAFHTDQATSMARMFARCWELQTADFDTLDTQNVTTMREMFDMRPSTDPEVLRNQPSGPQTLDLSSWDVSSVTDMGFLFANCSRLETLNADNWNTSNVTDMHSMFQWCPQLKTLDVSCWDVSSVTDMRNMFASCGSLQELTVKHWDVSSVTDMGWMFCNCLELKNLDVSRWDVSNVTNMRSMFYNINWQLDLYLLNWDVSNVTSYAYFMDDTRTIDNKPWKTFFET